MKDTRTRIQEVALELFTEQGYEATSLREIAERLGVTKAALYYHFKTKDDIVTSLTDDRVAAIDKLIAWAKDQPRTQETRHEILRRYADDMTNGLHHQVMRFMERNQTALRGKEKIEGMRERMTALLDVLCEPGDPLAVKLKTAMAFFTLHAVWFVLPAEECSDEERGTTGLEVAVELIDSARGYTEQRG
ncbi:TetR/AcrR family transcriptional regulator [Streptosporangiaceae bacterium NEAU-GS5]|nr:TetR/AcrR family transcriptional regulator [Streptosporangiaceae bacterium NEAU-GS5]